MLDLEADPKSCKRYVHTSAKTMLQTIRLFLIDSNNFCPGTNNVSETWCADVFSSTRNESCFSSDYESCLSKWLSRDFTHSAAGIGLLHTRRVIVVPWHFVNVICDGFV